MTVSFPVVTEGLTKHYGQLAALDGLSLQVPAGEILAVVGPNGAGKTTALKLMVGLVAPTSGRAIIAGQDVHQHPVEAKRALSFIPDQPVLYEQLTVAELVAFIGGMYALPPPLVEQRAAHLLSLFALDAFRARRIGQLSYGMRSRLALVVGLLHHPQVLVMDEPFFGLDPQTLRLVKQLVVERAREGMTIILSTHQLSIVEDVAHRIAIISQGRLQALGSLEALRRQYGGMAFEELFFKLTDSAVSA